MTTSDLKLLSIKQINDNLEKFPNWSLDDNGAAVVRTFVFENFISALEFVNKVAKIAEFEGHHPDIRIYGYKNVEIKLSTHSVGGLTDKDFDVVSGIDGLAVT